MLRNRIRFYLLFLIPIAYYTFLLVYPMIVPQVSRALLAVLAVIAGISLIIFFWHRIKYYEIEVGRAHIIKEGRKEEDDEEDGS